MKLSWTGLFLIVILAFGSIAQAGPFSTFPGCRARSLAGAFTAVADDPSAIWYNPAGLADDEHDLVLEYAQAITINEKDGPLDVSQSSWFAGGSLNTIYGDIGLFFFSPYTPKYWAGDSGSRNVAWGHIHEIMQIISLPYAVSLFDERLKIGLELEYVNIDIEDSHLFLRDSYGIIDKYDLAEESAGDFTGSAGILLRLLDNDKRQFTLGATYRAGTSTGIGIEAVSERDTTSSAGALFFDKPDSYDIGLAYKRIFSTAESLLFSLQYGSVDWGGARASGRSFSYNTYALGLEYQLVNQKALFKIKSVRLGYYQSLISGASGTFGSPEVSGFTWGLGLTIGDISKAPNRCDHLTLEIGQDFRMQSEPSGESGMLTLIMLNWAI